MISSEDLSGVWVFGDYRNYFQNRVTLQLIAKGRELAAQLRAKLAVVVMGEQTHQYAMEYVAHGAEILLVGDHPELRDYPVETYTDLLARWVGEFKPEIFLAGATSFGREFFPRLAKRLNTGLSADCVSLEVDPDTGLLIQTTPAFGGDLLAEVVTPRHRPQMATVHPGIFQERPHEADAVAPIIYPELDILPRARTRLMRSWRQQGYRRDLENAQVVVVGGRGLGSKEQFDLLFRLAELLDGEVGATRPAVTAGWAEPERLVGQTGKTLKPKLLISVGTSGALQYITGILGAETIVALNRDPDAPIFEIADLGLVGDAERVLPRVLDALERRL